MRALGLWKGGRVGRDAAIVGFCQCDQRLPKIAAGQFVDVDRDICHRVSRSRANLGDAGTNNRFAHRDLNDFAERRDRDAVLYLERLAFGVADAPKPYHAGLKFRPE